MGRWEYFVAASACLAACSFDTSNSALGPGDSPGASDGAPNGQSADASTAVVYDAAPGSPDAAPDSPDAAPGSPDAAVEPDPLCDSNLADLVLCMQFEDTAGTTTLLDESQYGNNATVSGAAFGMGLDGQALQGGANFDSVIAGSASLNATTQLTMEAWINPDEDVATGRRGLFDNNSQYGLFIADGNRLRCSTSGGPNITTAGAVVTRAQWQHVACVYDGTTMVLYVDGADVGSVAGTGEIATNGTDGSSLAQNSPDGDEFHGRMDTLRIWDSARSRAQLCAGAGLPCP